jgi:hypothetical protein
MPATLTAAGINFNDGTSASARSSFFAPSGTVSLFYRSTAPTNWTQVTTQNDKILRVVSGTGGGAGGINAFSNTFTNRPISANVPVSISGLTVQGTTLSVNTIPIHGHPANNGGNTGGSSGGVVCVAPGSSTGNYGNGGGHGHPASFTSANGPWSTTLDFRVQYIDVIICSFNG